MIGSFKRYDRKVYKALLLMISMETQKTNTDTIKNLREIWLNNQKRKDLRCGCCEWKLFIIPNHHKYIRMGTCEGCLKNLKKQPLHTF